MEYFPSIKLSDYIQQRALNKQTLSLAEIFRILLQTASGLSYLHQNSRFSSAVEVNKDE